ncbi:hypothetical protein PENFLA_c012G09152 [Penicillium flavigenum]|uniref:Uncharacterized protein n=1 Tax=Penicillium flavigenum TaxID=254877 RepID=A0A1V6T909_9EURO|nr:hypothetical protein PENFLA_c012G09152 [Penicillium flavigenum]
MAESDENISFTSLMSALPPDHIVRTFSHFKGLRLEAEQILKSLTEIGDGNQFMVILNLSARTIKELDEEHHRSLGAINYRFQWEGTTGLIKVVPSERHDATSNNLSRAIDRKLTAMGIRWSEMIWAGTSTYKPTAGAGKQGDQAFLPPARCPNGLPSGSWPTFVIEAGVSQSISRLREDARRWFVISEGLVRIVIIISIKSTNITFEKWQLAPSSAPRPLTRAYLNPLRAQNPNIPPLTIQLIPTQQPYSVQEVYVEPNRVVGAPLVIPFVAIYDRLPGPGEHDILLNAQDFLEVTEKLF